MNIEKALNFLRDRGKEHSIALAQKEYLKEFRKAKIALLMVEAEKNGISVVGKQDVYARSHPEYQELLRGYEVAVQKEAELRHLLKAAELKVEVWRTQQSTRRTEMNNYNRNVT